MSNILSWYYIVNELFYLESLRGDKTMDLIITTKNIYCKSSIKSIRKKNIDK